MLNAPLPYIHRSGAVIVRAETAFAAQFMRFAAPGSLISAPWGNVNSHVLHSPSCGNLPSEKNSVVFASLDEALGQGV
jgi:hypothetical protein